ncbi:uncharacterized protein PITG_18888 [Phytophthora infestans T30-4]|uniref:Uncharacterized protein n=1 Tax=Phytophthora infestans (strain T30-4) TaxID=403677 RepID=D0NZP0_PHYIT|nr:uncharacterized protein PITG_18888 [Phytophthora infestans T30-4]EEY69605.1 conserved hypothetical protein [Phytophthora infestans T30-4]|eukprot:XP_002997166.1 conserved hypothetical protein [Phytophthora infestans T30-4]
MPWQKAILFKAKLKALIQNELLDDASADSLASLFQQVMAKNREYEYDQITKKLLKGPKGPPEIIKGEAHEAPKASKKKHTYVPQSTDADFDMEEPTASKDSSDDFYSGIHDVAQKAINTRAYVKGKKTLKQVVDDHVRNYLNKQREFKREDSMRRRQEIADKFADEEEPSITRQLFQDSDVESSDDEEIKEEKRLRKLNPGIKKVYTDDINSYKSSFANNLYESIRHRFGEAVEARKGKEYFEDNAPKAPRKHKMKRDAMNQYKAELKGWLDGIFI